MDELLAWIQQVIDTVITTLGYPGIALVMFAENVFPPIPSELVMPFAGFQVATGEMNFVVVLIAGTIGALLGALVLYYVGLWSNETIVRRFVRRYGRFFLVSEDDIDRALDYFTRYGHVIVFFGRLIPLIRSLISLPAGMNRMPMAKFLLWTTAGTLIWNVLLTVAGMVLAENWQNILGFVDQYEAVMLTLMALALAYFVFTRLRQRRRVGTSDHSA